MATKERLYRVTFDTQKYRRYITWGFFVIAHNQSEAKDEAACFWHSKDNPYYKECKTRYGYPDKPHMFHVNASRIPEEELDHELRTLYKIADKYVTWGYHG